MAVLKCKMCGGELEIVQGSTVCVCEYCGTRQTVPHIDNEKKVTLFSRANRLRLSCEFDKAYSVYESIVDEFNEEAEAYFGLVLCKYGIEYVDDPKTGKKIPTCHRSSYDSVMDDANLELTLEYADAISRSVYREEAKRFEEIRKGIIEISSREEPYDIFICYKETDFDGNRTIDSVIAQDTYEALTAKGYRVFFSRITLESKLGMEYEPIIFSALNSSKVMLVFGTDYEHFNGVWVKNEWSRFLKLMEKDKEKFLIPCFKGIDAYDMPKEFAHLQAQDMGKVGAIQDLIYGIEKLIGRNIGALSGTVRSSQEKLQSLLKRAKMALEDEDYKKAEELFEKILDQDDTFGEAYLGLDFVKHKVKDHIMLANAYALSGAKPSSNLSEAKSLMSGAPWIKEFEDSYAKAKKAVAEKNEAEKRKAKELEEKKHLEELKKYEIGGVVTFGAYIQNDMSKRTPIEWQVIAREEKKALLVTKLGLDSRYYSEDPFCTWENSDIRAWLNNEFLNEAFDQGEQKKILLSKVINKDNDSSWYGDIPAGNDTKDKVFLLSYDEVYDHFGDNKTCAYSEHAKRSLGYTPSASEGNWWLRSPGDSKVKAARVTSGNMLDRKGEHKKTKHLIRPAMWVKVI